MREVVVLREPPTVNVYDLVQVGRRWYRSLVFSSNDRGSVHSLPAVPVLLRAAPQPRS